MSFNSSPNLNRTDCSAVSLLPSSQCQDAFARRLFGLDGNKIAQVVNKHNTNCQWFC